MLVMSISSSVFFLCTFEFIGPILSAPPTVRLPRHLSSLENRKSDIFVFRKIHYVLGFYAWREHFFGNMSVEFCSINTHGLMVISHLSHFVEFIILSFLRCRIILSCQVIQLRLTTSQFLLVLICCLWEMFRGTSFVFCRYHSS